MTGKTSIEWTWMPGYEGAVWNATVGCTRVSAGCDNCYAFALHDQRYKSNLDHAKANNETSTQMLRMVLGTSSFGVDRDLMPPFPKQYDLPFSRVQLLPDRLNVPLRTRKPTCYFVDSMSDLFHEDVPDEFIDRVFAAMLLAQQHRFLVLTKRPERMRAYVHAARFDAINDAARVLSGRPDIAVLPTQRHGMVAMSWPVPNLWLGTSVEDQRAADERIPHLLATPAAVRFLSCEPLIAPIDLERGLTPPNSPGIDWVIVGGESGPRARPFDLAWARSLRDQCASAGVAFFMKQMGSNPRTQEYLSAEHQPVSALLLRESHGRNPDEWPEDLRVREWPR